MHHGTLGRSCAAHLLGREIHRGRPRQERAQAFKVGNFYFIFRNLNFISSCFNILKIVSIGRRKHSEGCENFFGEYFIIFRNLNLNSFCHHELGHGQLMLKIQ